MDDELIRRYRRWHEAEEAGREGEGDEAFRAVMAAVPREPPVRSDFTARTVSAIAGALERDRRRAQRARRAGLVVGVSAAALALYAGGPWALAALSRTLVGALDLLVRLTVFMASSMDTGSDIWSVLASIGRALAALVSDPAVTVAILAMQGIAMAALAALHRLLGSDRESLK